MIHRWIVLCLCVVGSAHAFSADCTLTRLESENYAEMSLAEVHLEPSQSVVLEQRMLAPSQAERPSCVQAYIKTNADGELTEVSLTPYQPWASECNAAHVMHEVEPVMVIGSFPSDGFEIHAEVGEFEAALTCD